MAAAAFTLTLIALFYLIGGPPRKWRYKFLDILQAYAIIALFCGCTYAAYRFGKDIKIRDVTIGAGSILIGIAVFWFLLSLYHYLRTPKHLRSKKFR